MNQEIVKLVDMAFSDGILSEKEKEILFRKADKLGIDRDEFELYLQGKIDSFLTQKNEDKQKCPNCGGLVPVLSMICSFCSYNLSQLLKTRITIDELIENIAENIANLKSVPKHNVIKTLYKYGFITVPIIAIMLFSFAIRTGTSDLGYMFMILSVIFGIISIALIYQKFDKKTSNIEKAKNFDNIKANFEKNKLLAKTYYGDDIRVSKLLKDFNKEVSFIEEIRLKNKKIITGTYLLILLVIILSYFLVPKS